MSSTHCNAVNQTFTTMLTTAFSKRQENGDSTILVVILIVVPITLLFSCGGFVYYILKKRKNVQSFNYQQRIEKGAENSSFSGDTERISVVSAGQDTAGRKESGAYKSYDAVTEDLNDIEKLHDLSKEKNANGRQSKESLKSGAYMSFDDLEHVVPDLHMSPDDFTSVTGRMSNYCDFTIPEGTLSDAECKHLDRQSLHDQLVTGSRLSSGKTNTYKNFRKSRKSGINEHTGLEIYNPAFSQREHSEYVNRTSSVFVAEKAMPGS